MPCRAVKTLRRDVWVDRLAGAGGIGIDAVKFEDVGLRLAERFPRLRELGLSEEAGAQLGKFSAALADAGRLHAESLHHGRVLAAIDDVQGPLPHAPAEDAALLELVGDDEPKDRVVLIGRTRRGGPLRFAERVDERLIVERQPRDRGNRGAEIGREVTRVKSGSPCAHGCRP